MSGPAGAIGAVERFLDLEVKDVLEIAMRSPAGGGSEWDAFLGHLGLVPAAKDARTSRVKALELAKGALPGEVRMALHVISGMTSTQLDRLEQRWPIVLDESTPMARRVRALRSRLVGMVERDGGTYDKKVQPATGGGGGGHMGSIFANVRATKGMRPWANIEWKYSLTIQCPGCGAPQELATQFTCAFCTGDLLGRRDLFEEYSA